MKKIGYRVIIYDCREMFKKIDTAGCRIWHFFLFFYNVVFIFSKMQT